MTAEESDFRKVIEKQNKEFYNRINPRNLSEAKRIVAKYNWKHSIINSVGIYEENILKIDESIKNYLNRRAEFLQMFSEYL